MKTVWTIAILFCSITAVAADMDPSQVLKDARVLMDEGKYEEALQKHIWYHNHALDKGNAQYGVRLSFALSDWVALGKKYPKAREALLDIRDDKTSILMDGFGSKGLFDDVASINNKYGEDAKTFSLFKELDRSRPVLARECWIIVKDIALQSDDDVLIDKYSEMEAEQLRSQMAPKPPGIMTSPLVGEWVPRTTSKGGMGGTLSLSSDFTAVRTFGAILSYRYRLEGDILSTFDEKGSLVKKEQVVSAGSTLTLKNMTSGEEETYKRTDPTGGSGIVGKWQGKYSSHSEKILHFTENNNFYFSVPAFSMTGTYSVDGDVLKETFPKRDENRSVIQLDNDNLTLTNPENGKTEKYRRKK